MSDINYPSKGNHQQSDSAFLVMYHRNDNAFSLCYFEIEKC